MATMLDEIHRLLELLPEKDLSQVRDFVKALLQEPVEITEEEAKEVRKGEREFQRGDWVRWQDVRRRDV